MQEDEKSKYPQLANEARILKLLTGEKGFAKYHQFGYENKCNILVMELLGPSLEDLFNTCNKKFTLKTILMLAEEILLRLEKLHSKNYVYRDIKPENMLMGLNDNSHLVHLVDFGLSKKYRDSKSHHHVAYRENKSIVGTVRYASINTQMGLEYSRRDDLEAVGYMLEYFWKGKLPWQGLNLVNANEKVQKILEMKLMISVEEQFEGLPVEFSTYMNYCKALKFSDKPDYNFLRKLFSDLFDRLGYERDYEYDWCRFGNKIKYENGSLSITIFDYNQDVDNTCLESNREASIAHPRRISPDEIQLQITIEKDLQKRETSEEEEEVLPEDPDEGNIDEALLDDSDFRLVTKTHGSWMDSAF